MMERLAKRNEGMAVEYLRFSVALQTLTEASQNTYAADTNDVPLLNEGLKSTAKHLDQSKQLLEDEARGWEEGVLEDLKRQRDCLVSMRDLFDRRDKHARDNIPYLEKRISTNEQKLQTIRNKPADQIKPGEAEKVMDAIFKVSAPLECFAGCVELTMRRTRNPSFNSMPVGCSSKSAYATNLSTSNRANTVSVDFIRIGVRSASNMQSCRQTTGER
jgi:hypothetical protein